MNYGDLELFCLGAAAIIDTALLMALGERANRRRLILPLVLLVLGAWLFHGGALVKALLTEMQAGWAVRLHLLALAALVAGLLLMPSAILHGALRAGTADLTRSVAWDWRYGLLYLPLLALPVALWWLARDPLRPLAALFAEWALPYLPWPLLVHSIAGVRFFAVRHRFAEAWARLFAVTASWVLAGLALTQAVLVGLAPLLWPAWAPYWLLAAALSPVVLAVALGYFIIRHRFMQLVLGRVFVYGVAVVAALLFHQVFLQELWHTLSGRYRVNFALVEGIALIALVLLVKPLRQRSAEALRYLLGQRIDTFRRGARRFTLELTARTGEPLPALLDWFCQASPSALAVDGVAAWLFAPDGRIDQRAGTTTLLADATVAALVRSLAARQQLFCAPIDAPDAASADQLQRAGIALAVLIDHPEITGLVAFARADQDLAQEQTSALVMVVEQLGITLHSSLVQASRLAAERHALQQEKLSTLGLLASSLAHEVKNPLASIKTLASVLAEDLGPTGAHAEDVRLMSNEIDRLARTVEQLLRLARPATVAQKPTPAAPSAVIGELISILRHLAVQRGVSLINELPPALPWVAADEGALRDIFFNLLANAIEAAGNRSGGCVALAGQCSADAVVIGIRDNGPGIAPNLRAQLFQPFVSGKEYGTGLGLYLVGRRVNELDGAIECTSSAGVGTCFTVKLPRAFNTP